MTVRCDWTSCKALRFDSKELLVDHCYGHFFELLSLARNGETFLCAWPGCASRKRKVTPFASSTALKKHLKQHVKDHWCSNGNCNEAFARESDLKRHNRTQHSKDRSYRCPVDSCEYSRTGFSRKDKLDNHTRKHVNLQCRFDHCEVQVLECEKKDHLNSFHSDSATFECALSGCESTEYKFTEDSATNHLRLHHRIYYESRPRLLLRARTTGPILSMDGALVIKDNGRISVGPCISCANRGNAQATQLPMDATV
jgi:uncharacterized Zn-finger protein